MHAIIIKDEDVRLLLDAVAQIGYGTFLLDEAAHAAWATLPLSTRQAILAQLHRKYRSAVAHWLRQQGAQVD